MERFTAFGVRDVLEFSGEGGGFDSAVLVVTENLKVSGYEIVGEFGVVELVEVEENELEKAVSGWIALGKALLKEAKHINRSFVQVIADLRLSL